VAGRLPGGEHASLGEDELEIGQSPTEHYSASKLAAERSVRRFAERETGPATVLRVGTVAPHWHTGRFQRNIDAHFLSRYLRAMLGLGLTTVWPERQLRLIPVDVMARAVYALSGDASTIGRTFHVQTPHALTYYDLTRVLQAFGYPIAVVAPARFADAVTALANPARAEDIGRMLPMLEKPAGRAVHVCADRSVAELERLGVRYPAPTTEWIRRFVGHGIEVGYLPAPPAGALPAKVPELLDGIHG
jgi:nucleoside-diphosphate-sugar epimerase